MECGYSKFYICLRAVHRVHTIKWFELATNGETALVSACIIVIIYCAAS